MKYNLDWLINRDKVDYLFFWGHQPRKDGSIGESCFSQWWERDFKIDGITYSTAEHWMMAEKARLFQDEEILSEILVTKSPEAAKKLGRNVKDFQSAIWDKARCDIVVKGNYHKFEQNADLKIYLLNTKNRILVEASPVDPIWGIGLAKDDPGALYPDKWRGLNLLGFALMEVRDELSK